jgi:hypothetical protein
MQNWDDIFNRGLSGGYAWVILIKNRCVSEVNSRLFVTPRELQYLQKPCKTIGQQMTQKFQTQLCISDGDVYHCFLRIPTEVAAYFIDGGTKRVVCRLQDSLDYHCGILHDGSGGYIVSVNGARRKSLKLEVGQIVDVALEVDNSEYGMPMSEEFREVMDQDNRAFSFFEKLTAGKQRSLIHWSDGVKSSEIKIRRALVVGQHLVMHGGRVEFPLLALEIKEANAREKRR